MERADVRTRENKPKTRKIDKDKENKTKARKTRGNERK